MRGLFSRWRSICAQRFADTRHRTVLFILNCGTGSCGLEYKLVQVPNALRDESYHAYPIRPSRGAPTSFQNSEPLTDLVMAQIPTHPSYYFGSFSRALHSGSSTSLSLPSIPKILDEQIQTQIALAGAQVLALGPVVQDGSQATNATTTIAVRLRHTQSALPLREMLMRLPGVPASGQALHWQALAPPCSTATAMFGSRGNRHRRAMTGRGRGSGRPVIASLPGPTRIGARARRIWGR